MSDDNYVVVCMECDGKTEIEVKRMGDEGWNYCPACRSIEGATKEITETEYESLQ